VKVRLDKTLVDPPETIMQKEKNLEYILHSENQFGWKVDPKVA